MECSICKKPTNQRCSRCQAKYYCGTSCQKEDYLNHVLVCPSRSADTLVKNVFKDLIPTKNAVRYEYGFCNCMHSEDELMLLGLYTGLIKYIKCSSSQLHSWWEVGNLPFYIKKAYNNAGYTSEYYQWFLKNERVLQGLRKYESESRSAEILVKDVIDDFIPTNGAVRYEYGFRNCVHPEEESKLGGLYAGLIKIIGCSASQLHSWWESGNLPFYIKKAYNDAGYTSGYYQWFLNNEHVLQGLRKYEGEKSDKYSIDKFDEMVKPYLSEHDQTVPIKSFPESKRVVCVFYTTMLSGRIPKIEEVNWIEFGFCSCKFGNDDLGEMEERRLGDLYRELIIQKGCKVDEFHDAYLSGTILDLLRKNCSSNNCNWLSENKIEIYGYNQTIKSAYYLKQYTLSESVYLIDSVNVDYGFDKCRTEDEKRQLKHIYRKLIKTPRFDPRDLHEACLAGKTFDYVKSILPNEVLKARLFKNLYPLKDD